MADKKITLANNARQRSLLKGAAVFREDNLYPQVVAQDPATGLYSGIPGHGGDLDSYCSLYSDFIGPGDGGLPVGYMFDTLQTGTVTVKRITSTSTHTSGVQSFALSATSEAEDALLCCSNDGLFLPILKSKLPVFEARVLVQVLPSAAGVYWFAGLGSTPVVGAYASMTQLVGFSSTASGVINYETDDNTTDTAPATTGTTAVAADQYRTLRVDCGTLASVKFYIDNLQVGTALDWSATPTDLVQPIIGCGKPSGTGVCTLYVDYVRCTWQR